MKLDNKILIDRVQAFDDSQEIADALEIIATTTIAADAYWLKEAAVHIEGLFELATKLGKALESIETTEKAI